MRISDWSSDVCSSDLNGGLPHCAGSSRGRLRQQACRRRAVHIHQRSPEQFIHIQSIRRLQTGRSTQPPARQDRSEERRVGKACVSTCRLRWAPYHYKKKTTHITLKSTHNILTQ